MFSSGFLGCLPLLQLVLDVDLSSLFIIEELSNKI
jgi:hypothetical protein